LRRSLPAVTLAKAEDSSTQLSSALYSIAIRQIPALESNLILMLEPVLNPLWVFLVIGESPTAWP